MQIVKPLSLATPIEISEYILYKFGAMSHLKLQKLLFYCEAYHLAYFNSSLIREDFEAWVHGPVCRPLYNTLKDKSILYSDLAFMGNYNPEENLKAKLTTDQLELINDILKELSTWTGLELEASTHREQPWIDARKGYEASSKCSEIISKASMKEFYKKDLNV